MGYRPSPGNCWNTRRSRWLVQFNFCETKYILRDCLPRTRWVVVELKNCRDYVLYNLYAIFRREVARLIISIVSGRLCNFYFFLASSWICWDVNESNLRKRWTCGFNEWWFRIPILCVTICEGLCELIGTFIWSIYFLKFVPWVMVTQWK